MALSYRYPVTTQMEDNWYEKALSGHDQSKVYFAIENISDGKHIGFTHLYNIDYISSVAYLGIVIGDKTEQGKGKAREAMHILLQFAYKQLNIRKVNLEVAAFNPKAIDLYKSLGFKTEGIFKEQIFMNGRYYDKHSMALFRDEYYHLYPSFNAEEIQDLNYNQSFS